MRRRTGGTIAPPRCAPSVGGPGRALAAQDTRGIALGVPCARPASAATARPARPRPCTGTPEARLRSQQETTVAAHNHGHSRQLRSQRTTGCWRAAGPESRKTRAGDLIPLFTRRPRAIHISHTSRHYVVSTAPVELRKDQPAILLVLGARGLRLLPGAGCAGGEEEDAPFIFFVSRKKKKAPHSSKA